VIWGRYLPNFREKCTLSERLIKKVSLIRRFGHLFMQLYCKTVKKRNGRKQ
jgi:hypothetical protein